MSVVSALNRVYVIERRAATSANGAAIAVTALTDRGKLVWKESFPYTPKPMPAARVDSLVERATTGIRRSGFAVTESQVRAQLYIPKFLSPVSGVVAAADGQLWLRREESTAEQSYWVIDPSGRHIATISAPPGATVGWIGGDTAWGTERGDDDVPRVVKYRIDRSTQSNRRP